MDGDIVIRGGSLIDGTGAPARPADVAVADGRIVGVGEGLRGEREIDASGQVVAPGFIDIHTHYDAQVFWDPWLTPSSFHGVTSVVAGNCGFSIAPIRPELVSLLARTLQHVEDMSFDTLSVGVPWDEFETFPQYLDAVERRGTALNYGCYVGPHRGPDVRHGGGGLRAARYRRRARRHAGGGGRVHGGGRHGLRRRARRPPTTATAGGRSRHAWRTSTSSGPCSCPCTTRARAWWRCFPAG